MNDNQDDAIKAAVIYHPISSKFQAWITFIKLLPTSEYKFCSMQDNKMAAKMAASCRFALVTDIGDN